MIDHIPREENVDVDMLAKLPSSEETQLLGLVPVEMLSSPSIKEVEAVMELDENESWMTNIKEYLTKVTFPKRRSES